MHIFKIYLTVPWSICSPKQSYDTIQLYTVLFCIETCRSLPYMAYNCSGSSESGRKRGSRRQSSSVCWRMIIQPNHSSSDSSLLLIARTELNRWQIRRKVWGTCQDQSPKKHQKQKAKGEHKYTLDHLCQCINYI